MDSLGGFEPGSPSKYAHAHSPREELIQLTSVLSHIR